MRGIDWCQLEWLRHPVSNLTRKNVHNLTGFLDLAGIALFQVPKKFYILYKHLLIRIQDKLDEGIDWCQLEWSTTSSSNLTSKNVHNLTGFLDLAGIALFQVPKKILYLYTTFVNTDSGQTR